MAHDDVRPRAAALAVAALVFAACTLAVGDVPLRGVDDARYIGLAHSLANGLAMRLPGYLDGSGWYSAPGWPLLLSWGFGFGL